MTSEHSQRAKEVAEDLFRAIDSKVDSGVGGNLRFHLDGSEIRLDRTDAEAWVKESVDGGYPQVRWYIESAGSEEVVINLAAFEDPDSQYWP